MDPNALIAIAILAGLLVALIREVASPAPILIGGVVLFVLAGILPAEQAFAGLSNPATISIAGLYVVARAVRDHAGLDRVVDRLLGDGTSGSRGAVARLVGPVLGLSGVVNNTPLVAATGPIVRTWAERRGVAATHLLIPLSFAAILGGLLTTIGTSPTLVVSGLMLDAGQPAFTFFTITAAGLPIAVIGGLLIVLLAPKLLPDRRSPHEQLVGHERDYTVRLAVTEAGPVAGRTVAEAGLRELPTTYLASIVRAGHPLPTVSPNERLTAGDELVFVGQVGHISELLAHPGLVEAEQPQTEMLDGDGHQLVECVVASNSPLVGATLKSSSFRGRYGGAVVAIHRAGTRVQQKLGTVDLHGGDALLVYADNGFPERWQDRPDFSIVAPFLDGRATTPAGSRHRWTTLGTLAGMVTLAATGLLPILTSILLACSVLVATRAIAFRRALDALDRDVLLIVAAAIGLGAGMQASGLAAAAASLIGQIAVGRSPLVAIAAVVLGTMLLTELITNVAAAALMVPIAIDVAERVGYETTGFAVAVAVAASSSFLTPIGYQTNTMVYGLGGYRFGDFWRLGLPLAALTLATCLVVVPLVWG
ncbi:SLC13 family permease [Nitriliruptor alkaliphilus]|uniref:SLC13 family permease n=1 Tax=Nitriliruptor alkaliphilus TaxID=427918 RepID=UPI00069828AF|nr:SLC13 family permease [Nitriliruptor alkaliphilus]